MSLIRRMLGGGSAAKSSKLKRGGLGERCVNIELPLLEKKKGVVVLEAGLGGETMDSAAVQTKNIVITGMVVDSSSSITCTAISS
ncbi:hypothetical protein ACOSP7_013464 [Xanthoceras sorbifolium]